MVPILATALTALIPGVEYLGRALVDRFVGAPKPTPELIAAQGNADAAALQAVGQMESSYTGVSYWVNNIRALIRPLVALGVLSTWIGCTLELAYGGTMNPAIYLTVCEIASGVFFYAFGQRTMVYFDNNWFRALKNGK